ncbi:MAG: cobalamin B12-binding domain-containing protein, partial [Candidatus Woesearchaeota archaeon]|nr:cobalamin B12-binding domain-containing protein [Candidatus Woesearchaeota archaeon]
MADVILIQCPPWDTKFPPLGLAYLASNLNKKGITAEVVDLNIDIYNDSLDKNSWEMKQFQYWNEPSFVKSVISQHKANISCSIRQIVESSPRIIGFSLNSANFLFSYEILKAIKHRLSDVLVCMGGPGITYEHGRYLIERFKEIDFAILGEAEDILPRIL